MSKFETKHKIFLVVFSLIALTLTGISNYLHQRLLPQAPIPVFRSEQPRPTEVLSAPPRNSQPEPETVARNTLDDAEERSRRERQAAAERAAAEHAKFLARYVNSGFARKPGAKMVALVAVSENGKLNHAVGTAISGKLNSDAVQTISSILTPEFVSDGLFNTAFSDSYSIFKKLELANSVDALVLARETVRYTKNPSLENVTSAHMELEIGTFSSDQTAESHSWKFNANGAGFNNDAARLMAEDRLIKQLDAATNITPTAIFPTPMQ